MLAVIQNSDRVIARSINPLYALSKFILLLAMLSNFRRCILPHGDISQINGMKLEIANDVKYQTCLGGRNLAEQMSKLIPNDNPCVSQLPGNGPVRIECGMVTRTGR